MAEKPTPTTRPFPAVQNHRTKPFARANYRRWDLTRHDLAARSPLVPVILTIVAIVSIQLGAAIAKTLFSRVGPQGVSAIRLAFASILMLVILRPWRMRLTPAARRNIVLYGGGLGRMKHRFFPGLCARPLRSPG